MLTSLCTGQGVPTYPDAGRFWAVCEKYAVNSFYTAPTAIRALKRFGDGVWPAVSGLFSVDYRRKPAIDADSHFGLAFAQSKIGQRVL
jgi:hypothetical protein